MRTRRASGSALGGAILSVLPTGSGCSDRPTSHDPTESTSTAGTTTASVTTSDGDTDGTVDTGFTTNASAGTTGSTTNASADTSTGGASSTPVLELSLSQVKQFDFSWAQVAGAEHYQLLESSAAGAPWAQLGDDIIGGSVSHTMPLCFRFEASYALRACDGTGCVESEPVSVMGSLAEAVGYFKASNTGSEDVFGHRIALSDDGSTLAVGAYGESSNATGIDGDQGDDSAFLAGAVYVFAHDASGQWTQQAYVKASNTDASDGFGGSVALSGDGSTLAVGASAERSGATGIDGNQADDSVAGAGAAYVFVRDGMGQWAQQAYVKASNPGASDYFGTFVSLSANGDTLVVGASGEDGGAAGVNGDDSDDSAPNAGAAYVFVRDGMGQWSQQAYIKASNPNASDYFGDFVAIDDSGDTVVVGVGREDSGATGIDGDELDDSAVDAGAAYVFVRDGMGQWSQQAYIKASNTNAGDHFGWGLGLSGDGNTMVVGAVDEGSNAAGIDGDQLSNATPGAGAAYVFVRDDLGQWSQQAYVKASNPDAGDHFGTSIALTADGGTFVTGARSEDSNATGIDGNQLSNTASFAGAAYVFVRDDLGIWSQQAYVKASNTDAGDVFGISVAIDADGDVLSIGATAEGAAAAGIGGNELDDSLFQPGAAYVFVRNAGGQWSQRSYVKASNPGLADRFGRSVALDAPARPSPWARGTRTGEWRTSTAISSTIRSSTREQRICIEPSRAAATDRTAHPRLHHPHASCASPAATCGARNSRSRGPSSLTRTSHARPTRQRGPAAPRHRLHSASA